MKLNMESWWSNIDRGKQNYWDLCKLYAYTHAHTHICKSVSYLSLNTQSALYTQSCQWWLGKQSLFFWENL